MKNKQVHITLDIQKLPEGYYVATSKEVQGLVAQAKTFEKTVEIAADVARTLIRAQSSDEADADGTASERIIYPMTIQA